MWSKRLKAFWDDKYTPLAIYNSEVSRGISHSDGYKQRMAQMQKDFISEQAAWAERNGFIVI